MPEYKVIVTWEAIYDMADILDYIQRICDTEKAISAIHNLLYRKRARAGSTCSKSSKRRTELGKNTF